MRTLFTQLAGLALLAFALVGCDTRTEQEVPDLAEQLDTVRAAPPSAVSATEEAPVLDREQLIEQVLAKLTEEVAPLLDDGCPEGAAEFAGWVVANDRERLRGQSDSAIRAYRDSLFSSDKLAETVRNMTRQLGCVVR